MLRLSNFDDALEDIRGTIGEQKGAAAEHERQTEWHERFIRTLLSPTGLLTCLKTLLKTVSV